MLSQHGEEGGKERNAKAGVKDGLTDNDLVVGTVPCLKGGCLAAECGVIHLINQNAEEGGCLLVEVGFDIILDVEDETRSYGREKTGLCSPNVSSAEAGAWKSIQK